MTVPIVERAGEREGDEEGLHGSPTKASERTASGRIMAQGRGDGPLSEPELRLPISGIVIEWSEDPAMVVGQSVFGKGRVYQRGA